MNWMTSIDAPDDVRAEWAREHGIDGVDGAEWDGGPGRDRERARRRVVDGHAAEGPGDPARRRTRSAGRRPRPGATPPTAATAGAARSAACAATKQSGLRAHLADGDAAGARLVERAPRDAVLLEGGRAVGVEAECSRPGDRRAAARPAPLQPSRGVVRAPQVVLAAGALRTPAVLEASGLNHGGSAAISGSTPCRSSPGVFDEPIDMWRGTMQAARSLEFDQADDGRTAGTRSSRRPATRA